MSSPLSPRGCHGGSHGQPGANDVRDETRAQLGLARLICRTPQESKMEPGSLTDARIVIHAYQGIAGGSGRVHGFTTEWEHNLILPTYRRLDRLPRPDPILSSPVLGHCIRQEPTTVRRPNDRAMGRWEQRKKRNDSDARQSGMQMVVHGSFVAHHIRAPW